MKKLAITACYALILLGVAGCITNLTADIAPNTDLTTLQSYYVRKLPADDRGVQRLIADRLSLMGKNATSGVDDAPSSQVDAIVTYQDKWQWDMTMYMIQLDIQIRDPNSDAVLASGQSYRTSLVRKSPEEMVEDVLGKIFAQ